MLEIRGPEIPSRDPNFGIEHPISRARVGCAPLESCGGPRAEYAAEDRTRHSSRRTGDRTQSGTRQGSRDTRLGLVLVPELRRLLLLFRVHDCRPRAARKECDIRVMKPSHFFGGVSGQTRNSGDLPIRDERAFPASRRMRTFRSLRNRTKARRVLAAPPGRARVGHGSGTRDAAKGEDECRPREWCSRFRSETT